MVVVTQTLGLSYQYNKFSYQIPLSCTKHPTTYLACQDACESCMAVHGVSPDPSLLVAGDMLTVQQAALSRSPAGRGKIFTGNGARLEKTDSAPSTLTAPTVTSTPMAT